MDGLKDKIVFVTGGASGIGAAVIHRVVKAGATAICGDLTPPDERPGKLADLDLLLDVADPASVGAAIDAIVARYGRLDCVVHSAGTAVAKRFLDTTAAEFDRVVKVNLHGTFFVGQAAARAMIAGNGGSIVNIGSVSGLVGNGGRSAYGASKGGLTTLSKIMAVELAANGIRVNVVAPGPVDTPLALKNHSAAMRQEWTDRVPLGRYGETGEIADAVAYLCSDESSYITGHVLAVDGGFLARGLAAPPASSAG